jgi:thiol-disulfide isomerase/thioredoxin
MKSIKQDSSIILNPLVLIIFLITALIIVLAIFRPASNFLNLGFGINAHIGDVRGSFEFEAFDNSQPMFIMYYAEWCGHCKRTKPEFSKLLESYNGPVKIQMIDCEAPENAELVKSQNIKGFPTIRYYPNGLSENFQEYNSGRTYFDFSQYLNQVTGTLNKMPDNAAPVN